MDKTLLFKLSIFFAVVGLIVSIYLTLVHYFPAVPLACSESGVINCENVLTSQYALILGIPVAVYGIAFFVAELIAILFIKNNDYFLALSGIGIAFVGYFIYAEYMVKSICIYCTTVHICTLALLIIAIMQDKKKK